MRVACHDCAEGIETLSGHLVEQRFFSDLAALADNTITYVVHNNTELADVISGQPSCFACYGNSIRDIDDSLYCVFWVLHFFGKQNDIRGALGHILL